MTVGVHVIHGPRMPAGNWHGEFGGYQAVLWDKVRQAYWSASEMRKDGAALGY